MREHLAIVAGRVSGEADEKIETILASFDLAERAAAYPGELSEGECARLSVARALTADAEVLVLDEPLVHVDPARAPKYWRAIRDHLGLGSGALVFATHEPERVLGEAQHVICLREGQVQHAGPVNEFYADPPTPQLMEFLGPGNWLTPEEAELWLDEDCERARCFRPEQVDISPANISHVVVRSVSFRGAIGEVELHHINAAVSRRFFHRPAGPALQPGMPAVVRLRE